MEDELRDPSNFVEYLLPRPLRLLLTGFGAASCAVATIISGAQYLAVSAGNDPALVLLRALIYAVLILVHLCMQALRYHESSNAGTVVIDLLGCLLFGALFCADRKAADARVERRAKVWCVLQMLAHGDLASFCPGL